MDENIKSIGLSDDPILSKEHLNETDDVEVSEEKLITALKQTDFKELQKMEKQHGFRERLKSDLFFRKGKTGEWKKELPRDLTKKIEKLFHKEMVELGYM